MYTVKEVSDVSGVTVKTLHYYHKIGLLVPSVVGENKYRYYTDEQINILQTILFYRALDFSLKDIQKLMSGTVNRLEMLEEQRALLLLKKEEVLQMLETIDKSIKEEKGDEKLDQKEKFKGLEQVDSLGRSMQNITVIMSKPMYLRFLIVGIALVVIFTILLFDKTPRTIRLENGQQSVFWLNQLPREGVVVACLTFIVAGIISIVYCIHGLFFTKTKDLLDIVNGPYQTKAKSVEDSEQGMNDVEK